MMTRAFFAALVLALAAAEGSAQDLSQKVTLSSPAASAKKLLEGLSKAAGISFMTSPQTSGEILIVDVKDVTLDDLMKRIAAAASGEWQPEGQGFRLIRPQALQTQQEREYLEDRAAKIRKDQEQTLAELGKQKPLTAAEARRAAQLAQKQQEEFLNAIREGRQVGQMKSEAAAAMNMNPASRLLMRLTTAISAADLARIGSSSRVVFSSAPTRVQRAMPSASGRAINDFLREYQIWLDAQPQQPPSPQGDLVFGGPMSQLQPMKGGLGKVLLVVSRFFAGNDLQAELIVADASGTIVTRQMRSIRASDSTRGLAQPKEGEQPAPASTGKGLALSQSAKEHAAFMNQAPSRNQFSIMAAPARLPGGGRAMVTSTVSFVGSPTFPMGGGGGPKLPVSPEWRQKLNRPTEYDPLSFAASELFMGWAKEKGANLVANLPDSVLVPLSTRSQQAVTSAHLQDISKNNLEIKVEESAGWMVVTPKFPASARSVRVNREELERMLTGIQRENRLSLDGLSRYASSRKDPAPQPAFDSRYVYTLFPNSFGDFQQAAGNWRMLQLYATLGPSQRKSLSDGAALNLGMLGPSQRTIVDSMVYDEPQGPEFNDPSEAQSAEPVMRTRSVVSFGGGPGFMMGGMGGKLIEERTEFLPNGVPGQGTLSLALTNQEGVFASRKDGSADNRFFTADAYGMYVAMLPNIEVQGPNAPKIPSYDTFKLANAQTLDFHFQLSPQASMYRQLRDSWIAPGASEVGYSFLPASFRQQAEEAGKRMGNASAKISIGGPGGGVKPPSP